MKNFFLTIAFCSSVTSLVFAQKMEGRLSKSDVIKLDFQHIAEKKELLVKKEVTVIDAYQQLLKEANELLNYAPVSVMDKKALPPSGNKHDYMSIGPYWWPDSTKLGFVPYKQRDGEINPEVNDYADKVNMPSLCENVYKLSLAYYFSNDETYAKHATKLIKVWFLDTTTKMNPNLNYAQAVKGVKEGRPEGLIDTRHFIYLLDGVELLKNSKSWTKEKQTGLKKWFTQFLVWMNTSENGNGEKNAKNNHGVWFDAQSLAIALYVDNKDMANEIVDRASKRLDAQMNDEGFFPLELKRTTSLHYSAFIMNAFNIIAILSQKTSINFWALQTPSGKSFKKGLEALTPYLKKDKAWTGKEIRPFNFQDGYPLLMSDAFKYDCKDCIEKIKKIAGGDNKVFYFNLL